MIKTLDVDQQLEMIEQAARKQKKTIKTPASFVQQLKANPDVETLRSLRVYLTTEPIDWLKQFRDCHGLGALSNVVLSLERERNQSENIRECLLECCSIVAAVAHSTEGIRMVMDPSMDPLTKVVVALLLFYFLNKTYERALCCAWTQRIRDDCWCCMIFLRSCACFLLNITRKRSSASTTTRW